MDASPADPTVIYAADTRMDLYRSGDGAKTWQWIGKSPASGLFKIVCGQKRRHVFLATPGAAFASTTGGASWTRLPLPNGVGTITDLQVDKTNPLRLYVVSDRGVYRSLDFGERWIGHRWECLTSIVPPPNETRLTLGQGKPSIVYGMFDGALRSLVLDGKAEWTPPVQLGIRRYVQRYPWLLVEPGKPEHVMTGYRLNFGDIDVEFFKGRVTGSLLSRSTDAGRSWTYSEKSVMARLREHGMYKTMLKALADLVPHFLETVAYDPRDPETLYASSGGGLLVSQTGGKTWSKISEGLDIPKIETLFVPASGRWIYAGTLAGLYRLERGKREWEYANLRLQFEKNTRRDLGGAAYLDAYWRGRYFGFITDEQATQDPTKWNIPEKYRNRVPGR